MSKIYRGFRKNGFVIVSNFARNDKNISFQAFGMLGYLMGFGEGWVIKISQLVGAKTNGRDSTYAIINELIEAGYIVRVKKKDKNNRFEGYDYMVSDEKDFSDGSEQTTETPDDYVPVYGKAVNGNSVYGKAGCLYNNKDNNKEDNNRIVDLKVDGASVEPSEHKQNENTPTAPPSENNTSATTSEHKQKKDIDTARAIEYLNEVTGRSFRTSEASMKHVRARLREGFTFDDLCAVVVFKNAQWAHKPDMKAYLRPETLFGTKFDGYLQEAKAAKAARVTVVEGANDKYSAYAQWAQAKYVNLGAEGLLSASEHENITSAEGKAHFMRTLSTRELNAVFENAHIEANRLRGVGQQARVADVFKRLINEAQKPK